MINTPICLASYPTPVWYKDSLSYALSMLAEKGKKALPHDLYTTLEETAGRVFIHESYVNDMYAFTRGRPIHPDNMFVYNGYKGALLNLLKVLSQPDSQLAARAQIYQQTHGYLHSILTVVHARCVDQLQAKLLKDPEFARLLVYLVGVL